MSEPIVGISAKVTIRPRIEQPDAYSWEAMNSPGNPARSGTRAPAIFNQGSARPRKLGHVLYTSPDFEASMRFLTDVLGFKISDTSRRHDRVPSLQHRPPQRRPHQRTGPVLPSFVVAGQRPRRDRPRARKRLLAVDPDPRRVGARPALPRQQPVLVLPRSGRQLRRVLRRPRSDPRGRRVGCSRLGSRQVAVCVGAAQSRRHSSIPTMSKRSPQHYKDYKESHEDRPLHRRWPHPSGNRRHRHRRDHRCR